MNSIAFTSDTCPQWMQNEVCLLWCKGFVVVKRDEFLALEAAKQRYELAFLENQSKTAPRSQRDSAPVEQHLNNERPNTEPDPDLTKQQERIHHLLKIIDEYRILLREAIG